MGTGRVILSGFSLERRVSSGARIHTKEEIRVYEGVDGKATENPGREEQCNALGQAELSAGSGLGHG